MPVRRRSQARVLALQALCVFDVVGDEFEQQLGGFLRDSETLAEAGIDAPPHPEVINFARQLVAGTRAQRARCDELLDCAAPQWTVARMSPVDRNTLRIGVYELLECPDRAPAVIINEAIDLAHRFGDADSPAFVNGVLDGLRRELEGTKSLGLRPARPDEQSSPPRDEED